MAKTVPVIVDKGALATVEVELSKENVERVDKVTPGVGQTGVVGLIRGRRTKTVGLRADMDALELEEEEATQLTI